MKALLFCLVAGVALGGDEWKLVWSDEFDHAGDPDGKKWTREVGFIRNQELQYYTQGRRENARVEGGHLILEARKEDFPNPGYQADAKEWTHSRKTADYTSACLITKGLASFHYGKIEVRAKLPAGKGVWPAIWTMGNNHGSTPWPACGEVDIMEFVSHEPGVVHGTLHFAKPGSEKEHRSVGGTLKSATLHDDFHVYGMVWDDKQMTLTFDGAAYFSFELDHAGTGPDNPFRKPMYLLLNVAVGGSWGRDPDPKVYPQRMEVDWVRYWQKAR